MKNEIILKHYEDERINDELRKMLEVAVKDDEYEERFNCGGDFECLMEQIDKIVDYVDNGCVGELRLNDNMWYVCQETLYNILDLYDLELEIEYKHSEMTLVLKKNKEKENEKSKKYDWDYFKIKCYVYKVEVGVLLDKDNDEYEEYKNVYDKKHSYYDENVVFELDYNSALKYAKGYVENGVNGTYAIISRFEYDSEKIYGNKLEETIEYAMKDINNILGGGYIDDYDGIFNYETHNIKNVIYSLYKVRNEDFPYYLGKGNGDIVENFIKKEED